MKNNKETENRLLNEDFDEFMQNRIENEIAQEIKNAQKAKKIEVIEDFKDVPKEHVFSLNATFYVFNRTTKQESYLNGIQAESLIGMRKDIRQNLLEKVVESFIIDNYYVKFASFRK